MLLLGTHLTYPTDLELLLSRAWSEIFKGGFLIIYQWMESDQVHMRAVKRTTRSKDRRPHKKTFFIMKCKQIYAVFERFLGSDYIEYSYQLSRETNQIFLWWHKYAETLNPMWGEKWKVFAGLRICNHLFSFRTNSESSVITIPPRHILEPNQIWKHVPPSHAEGMERLCIWGK